MMNAPTVGRPAQGFSSERAQKWVLASALITGMVYAFRRLIEPSVSAAPATGSKTARLLGAGTPPPALGQWIVAYGASHIMLAVLALGAPEVAASLAMLVIAGELLTNGLAVVADLSRLEGKPSSSSSSLANIAGAAQFSTALDRSVPGVNTHTAAGAGAPSNFGINTPTGRRIGAGA